MANRKSWSFRPKIKEKARMIFFLTFTQHNAESSIQRP